MNYPLDMNYRLNDNNRPGAILRLRAVVAAWTILSAAMFVGIALAQAPKAAPAFDVVAIRSADLPTQETMLSGQFRAGTTINEGSADFEFVTLADLLPYAYRVKSFQVIGPQSLRESRWNIRARLPQGGSRDQVPEMVQAMLVDRFKLEIHREKRELPVYELVVLKGGLKLKPSEASDTADDTIATPGPAGLFPFGGPPGGGPPDGRGPGNGPPAADGRVIQRRDSLCRLLLLRQTHRGPPFRAALGEKAGSVLSYLLTGRFISDRQSISLQSVD